MPEFIVAHLSVFL